MGEVRLGMAILAAGKSRRFGEVDKLTIPFNGMMLGECVARTVGARGFRMASVICAQEGNPCERAWRECGFEPVVNHEADTGMGSSVALAAKLAIEARCDKLLIALADMPLVPEIFYSALLLSIDGPDGIVTSVNDKVRMPPAVFGSDHFPALAQSSGDKGARELLAQGHVYPCLPEWLIDIDTPEDLALAESIARAIEQ